MAKAKPRILVTRPRHQSATWVSKLRKIGFATLEIPCLRIAALETPDTMNAIRQQIMALDEYYALIFVSQNAVMEGFKWIDEYWPELPKGLLCLGVGKQTQAAIDEALLPFGVEQRLVPRSEDSSNTMNSEALLTIDELQAERVKDKKLLICRGRGGRTLIADTLAARGANAGSLELYERLLPERADQYFRELTFGNDVISIFSGETLENFATLANSNHLKAYHSLPVLLPGERVEGKARELGFKTIIRAENASEAAMLAALVDWHSSQASP